MTAVWFAAASWTGLLAAMVWCGWRWQRVKAAEARQQAASAPAAPGTARCPRHAEIARQTAVDALELWYLLPAVTPTHEETR